MDNKYNQLYILRLLCAKLDTYHDLLENTKRINQLELDNIIPANLREDLNTTTARSFAVLNHTLLSEVNLQTLISEFKLPVNFAEIQLLTTLTNGSKFNKFKLEDARQVLLNLYKKITAEYTDNFDSYPYQQDGKTKLRTKIQNFYQYLSFLREKSLS
jgi:hypothetical protein